MVAVKLGLLDKTKSMVSCRAAHKSPRYFKNIGPNWSKLDSFVDKNHILHMIDLILG